METLNKATLYVTMSIICTSVFNVFLGLVYLGIRYGVNEDTKMKYKWINKIQAYTHIAFQWSMKAIVGLTIVSSLLILIISFLG